MKKIFVALASVLLLTSMYVAFINPVKAEARSDLDVTFYASDATAWTALLGGQADFIQWALTKQQKVYAETDPNIQLCRVDENGMFEFDINNNYSIATYPGMRSATNALRVRQAIARLVDKDYIIANILEYFGARIDAPIAKPQETWTDPSVIGANYPYPYNPQAAANLLAAEGFADTDANGWLNYPSGWPGVPERADTTAYSLVVCVRSDHASRLAAGRYLISQLEVTLAITTLGAGFKTTGVQWQQPRAVLSPMVMGARDFNVYTGGWSVGRYPTYLFSLFHSQFWYPYGPSYNVGMDINNNPNYPDVDAAVDAIWYTTGIAAAQTAAKAFTVIHSQKCINIPLWSYSSYWAWSKNLVGVVNENGYGLENAYTFMNAYRVGGGPIRIATVSGPDRLNILHSQWYFEYAFLDRVYTGGMSVQPYNLAVDQPWVIQDWETGTWDDAGTTKSMVTYYIRKDIGIVEPVTGNLVRFFDAHDFEFTVWYNYAFPDSWQFASFMDVKYTKIVDVDGDGWMDFQVYFDDNSYWFYSAPTYPLLPKQELLNLLCDTTTESWAQVGTATHDLANSVVQVVSCTLDGTTTLVEGVDYRIDAGYVLASHIEFYPLRDLTGTISITYWYADIPSTGFYLAGLPWQQTMYALGHHYPVSMTTDPPGIGTTIVCKKNVFFFMDKPLLGEIDWAWKWGTGAKPRGGNYKIEIFDVVPATSAYCTRGDGVFNPKFFPGADLDQTDLCHIGVFDLVSITGKYGKTFGKPVSGQDIHGILTTTPQTFTNAEFIGATQWLECGSNNIASWTIGASSVTVTVTTPGQPAQLDIQYLTSGGLLKKAHFST